MTVPNTAHERAYPMSAPPDDPRFTAGLIADLINVLAAHGYPQVIVGGDVAALQTALYGFLYRTVDERLAEPAGGPIPTGVEGHRSPVRGAWPNDATRPNASPGRAGKDVQR